MRHKHFLTGHPNGLEWRDWFATGDAGPSCRNHAGGVGQRLRNLGCGSRHAGNCRQAPENLLEGEILRAENVTLACTAMLGRQEVSHCRVAHIDKVQACINKGRKFLSEEVENDFACRRGPPIVIAYRRGWVDNYDR